MTKTELRGKLNREFSGFGTFMSVDTIDSTGYLSKARVAKRNVVGRELGLTFYRRGRALFCLKEEFIDWIVDNFHEQKST